MEMRRKVIGSAILLVIGIVASSCGSDSTGDSAGTTTNCSPGKQEACACPGGQEGAQRCKDDGSGWGACECPDAGTGGTGGGTTGSGGEAGKGGQAGAAGESGTGGGDGGVDGGDAGPGPNDDPCPTSAIELDCSDQCGGPTALCAGATCNAEEIHSSASIDEFSDYPYVIRTPSHPGIDPVCEEACLQHSSASEPIPAAYGMSVTVHTPNTDKLLKVSAAAPWWIQISAMGVPYYCLDYAPVQGCVVAPQGVDLMVMILTSDPNAPARNVVIDLVDAPGSCP